ncbi:MFS transporter [Parapedomonas caeni]
MLFNPDPPRHRSRRVFSFLGVVTFLIAIGNTGLVSVMPAIGRMLAIPDYLVASIFSLSALTWAVSAPLWVSRISRAGPNYYIRAGLVGFIASMAGCALSVKLGLLGLLAPLATFGVFFVLRSIYGLLGSASATATQALIAFETEGAQRTRALTTLAGALSLGTIVGPAIAPAMIVEPLGPLGPMIGFALLGGLALAGTVVFLAPTAVARAQVPAASGRVSLVAVWRRPGVGRHLTFGMLLCSAQAINIYTIGFVIIDRMNGGPMAAQRMIGLTMTAGAAVALAAQWGLVRLLSPSPLTMMRVGTALAMAGNALATFDNGTNAAFWAFVAASLGYGLARPGFSAAASLAGADEDQVAIASAITLIAGASITLPPVLASATYQWWSPSPFAIAALITAGLLAGELSPRRRGAIVHEGR